MDCADKHGLQNYVFLTEGWCVTAILQRNFDVLKGENLNEERE